MGIVIPVLALLVLAVVAYVVVTRTQVTTRDVAWLAGTRTPGPDEVAVYTRYLRRHREHRVLGGAVGGLFALIVGLLWEQRIKVGIGDGTPLGDLLFCVLAGIVVGALLAETYRLEQPQRPTASLQARPPVPGLAQVRAARAVTAAAVVLGAGISLGTGTAAPAVM
ncbi:hypothetical protein, partial [Cellulomonas bogoriensis]|uniref:hypothetical protein n=1 Tax=Cellulomonas bogoriensis TaxID=301388 RepID=UPI000553FA91